MVMKMNRADIVRFLDSYEARISTNKGTELKEKISEHMEWIDVELANRISLIATPADLKPVLYLIAGNFPGINSKLSNNEKKEQLEKMIEKYSIQTLIQEAKSFNGYFEEYMINVDNDYFLKYESLLVDVNIPYIDKKDKRYREALIERSIKEKNCIEILMNHMENIFYIYNFECLHESLLYIESKGKDVFDYFKKEDIANKNTIILLNILGINTEVQYMNTDKIKEYTKYILEKIEKNEIPLEVVLEFEEMSQLVNPIVFEEIFNFMIHKDIVIAKKFVDYFKKENEELMFYYDKRLNALNQKNELNDILKDKKNTIKKEIKRI